MSILLNEETKLIVQGITGREGWFHTQQMIEYGTQVVGGVSPGKGGTKQGNVPVFDTMREAVEATGANASVIYVPAPFAADAMLEALDSKLPLIVCITEGIPTLDMAKVMRVLRETPESRIIGPNCPGLITPGVSKIGIMPGFIHQAGCVGVVSRSGTLTYEVVWELTQAGLGESTCVGIGGDQIIGTNFIDVLKLFEQDDETKAIVLIGEIGGTDEEQAAAFIQANVRKPVVSFIAGRSAPPGKRMGHAGAIVSGGTGTAQEKVKALEAAGVPVATLPDQIVPLLQEKMLAVIER